MRLRYLHYFLIVAEEQSFARAAARVHIEPSPLSRAIRELENQLGVQLLDRSKGRIRLTWPGEVFREEASRMMKTMESARSRVHSASLGFHGRLRIGLADSLAQPYLTTLLARCREEEPRTEVRITDMTVDEMIRALSHGLIDVGITVDNARYEGLMKQALWTERPVVAIPTRHPLLAHETVTLNDMLRYPLVFCHPERYTGGYNVIRHWFSAPSLPAPTVAEYVTGHESMIMLVAAGYGIGIGLQSQTALYHHPDVIIRATDPDIPGIVTFAVTTDSPHAAALDRFLTRAKTIGQMTHTLPDDPMVP